MKKRDISRRTFIKGTGTAAVVTGVAGCKGVPWRTAGGPRFIRSGEKLNIACIGIGGKGRSDVAGVSTENIVALCDVDQARATEKKKGPNAYEQHPNARRYTDYREMLTEMADKIDAVTVTTPDHSHFRAAMMAIEMGKHVFVQKPLTHTIWEARQLTEAARRYGVATQMGNQGHACEGTRLVREWVQSGSIGPVHEVHLWTNRPIWPQGIDRPTDRPPVPSTLDWNLWLSTAPKRPYNPAYVPFAWRGWWDFGCGALGDMGCHIMDASFWALDLGMPTSVEAVSSPVNEETAPNWSIVTYRFPARGNMPPVKVVWYDGGKKPRPPKDFDRELEDNGQLLIGEKYTILAGTYCRSPRIVPETKMREFLPNRPPETIPRVPKGDHYQEWIRACKGGEPAGSNFDYSGPLTEMVLLGNLAIRTGKKIEWDGPNMRVTNVPEANKYIRTRFRRF